MQIDGQELNEPLGYVSISTNIVPRRKRSESELQMLEQATKKAVERERIASQNEAAKLSRLKQEDVERYKPNPSEW